MGFAQRSGLRRLAAVGGAIAVAAPVALGLAACGGEESATQEPAGEVDAFAACLREQGVDPQAGPGSGDPSAFAAARAACADLAPEGGFGGPGRGGGPGGAGGPGGGPFGGDPEAFFACLRDEGVEIPEGQGLGPGALDRSDPEVQAALEVCRGDLGAQDGSGATGTTTQAPVS